MLGGIIDTLTGSGNKEMTGSQGLSFLNNPTQKFRVTSLADPSFCLDVSPHTKQLVINEHSQSQTQLWRVMSDNQGNYGFMNLEFGTVLQIPAVEKGKEGAICISAPPNGGINEKWKIIPSGKKGYYIRSSLNGEVCLDIFE
jgi:hypothetical protein